MLNPQRLLVLREVGHRGSVAAAARALGHTEPSIVHHIRALETETAVKLVRRVGRVTALTEAGEALLGHADAIADHLGRAETLLAGISRREQGSVSIVAFPSFIGGVLPDALAEMARRHPGIVAKVVEEEPPEATAILAAGDADLAVVFTDPEDPDTAAPNRRIVPLGDDELRAVLPADHPLAGTREIDIAALDGERWIAGCPRCRRQLHRICELEGFEPAVDHATDDYVAVMRFVASGLGVALLPRLALDLAPTPGTVTVAVTGAPRRSIEARASLPVAPATEALLDVLAQISASQLTPATTSAASA